MKYFIYITLLLLVFFTSKAQNSVVSGGGEATGSGGTMSFSIGQIDYIEAKGTGGTMSQGVQQQFVKIIPLDPYTAIPDANFEGWLIDLGIDTDGEAGKVLTKSIVGITDLDMGYRDIKDLTGIQDFTSLVNLSCDGNQLTSLDLSKNLNLKTVSCQSNKITNLNVTNNIYLTNVNCYNNQLTALDIINNKAVTDLNCGVNQISNLNLYKAPYLKTLEVSFNNLSNLDIANNKNLVSVFCFSNVLESFDISNNPAIIDLGLSENQLTSLNLKNGNNALLNINNLRLNNNPNLSCILVDSKSYSDANWTGVLKDATATYNEECTNLSNADYVFSNLEIYPNPTRDVLHINNVALNTIAVHTIVGSLVFNQDFDGVTTQNSIDLSALAKGVYIVTLKSKESFSTRKVIVE